jgi:beta-galactosidase
VLFGAAYYHEYQPHERLKTDLDLMAEAQFTVIRVGESVWSTWEPENDRFDLEWLQPVLDGAHERGIAVLLGTPTYAVPPWLARQYPEIAGERATGQRIPWGARQEVDFTHPAFRFHAERVTRKILTRYAGHPAVIGFQVDNEPGNELLHNRGVFQRFVDHLRHTYGDVETLNTAWGLVYWSHRLSTLGGSVDPGRQRTTAIPAGVAALPSGPDHAVHRLAGRRRSRVRPPRAVRHHLSSPMNVPPWTTRR